MFETKVETPPDSPTITVIDPDDQPMWSSTRTVSPTPCSTIIQILISNNFHIKGTHMQMIRDNQLDGRIQSDPHRHIADFLEISNLFQYGENQEEAIKLRTFPFSLTGEAKTWLNELDERTITSWNELREAFISRYFSPAKFKRLLNKIHSFHQLDNKTLVDAWLRMKQMLRTCYGHGLTKAFKILEDKVLLKLDFSDDSQNSPKLKTVVSASGSNISSGHEILSEKFKALATKIDSEFLIIRKELKETREGLSNHQAIIQNLERQFEYLEKIRPTKSLPRITNTKSRHESVYKPPSIQNENDKGDVEFIKEDKIKPIPTIPNPNPINSNSPTVSPFLKDCTVHILYTNAKTFADVVLPNHVGDEELNEIDGVGIGGYKEKEIKNDEKGMSKEPNKEWKLNEKVVPHNEEVYHYKWHPTEIPHLNRIIKES
ncbi:reverse transcriptase domain-containing protein [Tanacetum coccineum]